jgi:hypothetical protein
MVKEHTCLSLNQPLEVKIITQKLRPLVTHQGKENFAEKLPISKLKID